jgi:hypothetical protein
MSKPFCKSRRCILEAFFCQLQNAVDVKLVHDFMRYRRSVRKFTLLFLMLLVPAFEAKIRVFGVKLSSLAQKCIGSLAEEYFFSVRWK